MSTQDYTSKDVKRFWSKVNRTDNPNECWEWVAGKDRYGYGDFWHNGDCKSAHRASYEQFYGEIPIGRCVLHTCDNRACVNPNHLFLGTFTDNNKDRDKKLRQARHEKHGRSKLTWEQVKQIRVRHSVTGISAYALAKEFHLNSKTISDILNNKHWKED